MSSATLGPFCRFIGGFRRCVYLVTALAACTLAGCGSGGGGGTSGGGGGQKGSYTINVSPATVDLTDSGPQTLTITATSANGYTGKVFVQLTGLPIGVGASPSNFNMTVSATGGSATVQLTVDETAQTGTSTIEVDANDGAITSSTHFALSVTITPKITLVLKPDSVSLTRGAKQTVNLSIIGWGGLLGDVTGTVTDLPAGVTAPATFGGFLQQTTLLDFSATQTAATISGSATITVTGQGKTASIHLPIAVSATPDFTISADRNVQTGQGSLTNFNVHASAVNGFSNPIDVSFAGLPAGVTISPATFSIVPGSAQAVTMTTDFTAVAGDAYQFTVQGVSAGITHTYTAPLIIDAAYINASLDGLEGLENTLNVPSEGTARFGVYLGGSGALGKATMTIDPIPAGITVTPTSFTVPASGGHFDVFVTAQTKQLGGIGNIILNFTYGPATVQEPVALNVTAQQNFTAAALRKASRFVRTDSTTNYQTDVLQFTPISPEFLLYHAATKRFFATDPSLGRVNVLDAVSEKLLGYLTIPGALAIDQAPDGTVLYVATRQGDVYVVDPLKLTVLKRYPSSEIGQNGFVANEAYALADGTLLVMDLNHKILARWNPQTNDITWFQGTQQQFKNVPVEPMCTSIPGNLFLTGDRSRAIVLDNSQSQNDSQVCSFDPVADTWTLSPQLNNSGNSYGPIAVVPTPDSTRVIAYDGALVYVLDTASMVVKSTFPAGMVAPGGISQVPFSIFASADSTKLFVPDVAGGNNLDVYNLATGQLAGWTPQPAATTDLRDVFVPYYQAMDSNGIAAGVMSSGGIGLLDTTAVLPLPVGKLALAGGLNTSVGPLAGDTYTWWTSVVYPQSPALGSVYFGDQAAAAEDMSNDSILAISPAGQQAGPVDVRTIFPDHTEEFLPDGFSYGPWVLETATQYATAEGGGPADVYGYGFGQPLIGTNPPEHYFPAPLDLKVSVGGNTATVTGYDGNPFVLPGEAGKSYFPQEATQYIVPPGALGTKSTIKVTNGSGSTLAPLKLTYVPPMRNFTVDGALIDGVYDARRDLYYFTDTNQIRVFSLSQGQWLSPITVKPPANAPGPQRLWGIALSPDGSRLAITDRGAVAIYLVDPDNPASQIAHSVYSPYSPGVEPRGVAVTNAGVVYFSVYGNGPSYVSVVDPVNGTKPPFNYEDSNNGGAEQGRLAISPDGSTIYWTNSATAAALNVSTGDVTQMEMTCLYSPQFSELAMDATGTHLLSSTCVIDSNLNTIAWPTEDRAEYLFNSHLYGAAFSAHGGLLFLPGPQWVDVFSGNTGHFTARVSLGTPLSASYRALVADGKDNVLIAITGKGDGIAVVDLSAIPEPAAPSYLHLPAAPPVARQMLGAPAPQRAEKRGKQHPVRSR